jgi:hypothetical protein
MKATVYKNLQASNGSSIHAETALKITMIVKMSHVPGFVSDRHNSYVYNDRTLANILFQFSKKFTL